MLITKSSKLETILFTIALCLAVIFGTMAASGQVKLIILLFAPIIPLVFILKDFRVGAILLTLLLPFQHTPFLPSFTGFNIVNYLTATSLFALWGNSFFKKKPLAPLPSIFIWAYTLPIVLAGIHGLFHLQEVPRILAYTQMEGFKSYFIGLVIKPLLIVLMAWLLGSAYMQTKNKTLLIIPIVAASVLPALFVLGFVAVNGFDLHFLSDPRARDLLSSLGMHANEFGTLLGIGFSLLLFLIPSVPSGYAKTALLFCFSLVSAALLLTFSRGGYAAAGIAVLSFLFVHRQFRYGILIFCILSIIIAFNPDVFLNRIMTGLGDTTLSSAAGSDHDTLTAGRVWVWKLLMPDFWNSPLLGNGLGATTWSRPAKFGMISMMHPHNLYLHTLLDLGLVGLGLFTLFVRFLFNSFKAIAQHPDTAPPFKGLANGARFALLGFLLSGLATGYYVPTSETSLLWMTIGLLLPLIHIHQKAKKTPAYTL